jgi:hypothetical protein
MSSVSLFEFLVLENDFHGYIPLTTFEWSEEVLAQGQIPSDLPAH